ncbi:hypothetical protein HaLaN_27291, partial [Haematococcus lacustris]
MEPPTPRSNVQAEQQQEGPAVKALQCEQ